MLFRSGENSSLYEYNASLVLSGGGDRETVDALWQGLDQWMNENVQRYPDEEERFGYSVSSTSDTREDMFSVCGAFLFLGLFLGTLFLLAAVLILARSISTVTILTAWEPGTAAGCRSMQKTIRRHTIICSRHSAFLSIRMSGSRL